MKKNSIVYLLALFSILSYNSKAQGYNIGIRAGISQTKFMGPSETNAIENFSLTGGFHFGINFQWNFNDVVGLRSEILYNQNGSGYSFDSDDAYYLYRPLITGLSVLDPSSPRDEWALLRDKTNIELNHSFAYLELPQTVHLRISDRFEVYGGGYVGFLLNPLAVGTMEFGEGDLFENPHIFVQGLDFDYDTDLPGEFNNFSSSQLLLIVNDQDVDIPRTIGAYYFFENEEQYDQKFKSIDYGLIGGVSYYLNRGFYTSLRVQYGLNDLTRQSGDVSYQELNADRTYVFNDDDDRSFGFYLSLGFKF